MKYRPYIGHFGVYIRRMRKEQGMTLDDLANETGVSKGNLSKIENGGNPTLLTVKVLCDTLSLDLFMQRRFRRQPKIL